MTAVLLSLVTTILAPDLNGIGIQQLKLLPSGLENRALSNVAILPRPWQKKSPKGALTAGLHWPSQYISNLIPLSVSGVRLFIVTHIRLTTPLQPQTSISVCSHPGSNMKLGDPFLPQFSWPPAPRAPVQFSGLAHLVSIPSGNTYNVLAAPALKNFSWQHPPEKATTPVSYTHLTLPTN